MSSVTIHGNTYDDVQAVNYVDKSGNQHALKILVLNGNEIWKSTQGYSLSFEEQTTLSPAANAQLQCYDSLDVDVDTGEYILGSNTSKYSAYEYIVLSYYNDYPFFYYKSEYYKTIGGKVSLIQPTIYVQKCIVVQG